MVLTLRGVAAAMESFGSTTSTVAGIHTPHMYQDTPVNSNTFGPRFTHQFEDVADSLVRAKRCLLPQAVGRWHRGNGVTVPSKSALGLRWS